MASFFTFVKRVYKVAFPPSAAPTNDSKPIKFGILGAANIAPIALVWAAISHPEVVVSAVAARNKTRAEAFARKHKILKAYGGYQELLDDPDIDAIYNPLPNGLHYEWTMKALAAGKHVLLEKPSSDTAEETKKMFDYAERKGLVLLEAFHYRFHPATQRVKRILDSGELGLIKTIRSALATPNLAFRKDDIRYSYSLGGGAMMDMGCYTLSISRYLASSEPISVVDATPIVLPPREPDTPSLIDRGMEATLEFPNSVVVQLIADLGFPFRLIPGLPDIKVTVTCERGSIELFNYVMPTVYHWIRVTRNGENGAKPTVTVLSAYKFDDGEGKGEDWWTTYRYQLEAFVDKVRNRTPHTWVTAEDSVANMRWIEEIYAKSGLGSRPKSTFVLEDEQNAAVGVPADQPEIQQSQE